MLDWKTPCKELISDVCPETVDEPVYLLSTDEAASIIDIGRDSLAGTGMLLSHRLQPVLSEWKGPGFAAVVNIESHRNLLDVEASVLHELAHHIERLPDRDLLCRAICGNGFHSTAVDAFLAKAQPPVDAPPVERMCNGHGPRFIRLCIHLWWRANRNNWGIEANDMFSGGRYALSYFSDYIEALGDEPERLSSIPLATLHSIDPPEAFRRLAESDYSRLAEAHKNAAFSEAAHGQE